MNSILDSILKDPSLTAEVTEKIRGIISHRSVRKGAILQRQGDMNEDIYFVKKGLLRSYIIDGKQKEHTVLLAPEGTLFSNIDSAAAKSPSPVFIDALEDTHLEVFNKDNAFRSGYLPALVLLEVINIILVQLIAVQNKIILLMSANAAQRYGYFTDTYPDILQRVPQKVIASYLAMTPQVLSKLRGQKKALKQ